MTRESMIGHIADGTWLRYPRDPARTYLTVYAFYYDASGHNAASDQAMVFAGVAATQKKWARLLRRWDGVLAEFGVPSLHMWEYAHSRGPFASWKGDEEKRADFLKRLLVVLKRDVNILFSVGCLLRDWRAADSSGVMTQCFGSPYSFCGGRCVHIAERWRRKAHPGTKSLHYVEHGDEGQGVLVARCQEEGIYLEPIPKRDSSGKGEPAFEPADLLAYELQKAYVGAAKNPRNLTLRVPMRRIVDGIPHEEKYVSLGDMVRFCKRFEETPSRDED